MSMRYPQDVTLNLNMPTVVGPSQPAGTPVSKPISVFDPANLRVDILVTDAAFNGGSITFTLQVSPGDGSDDKTQAWLASKTAVITGSDIVATDTWVTLTIQAVKTADQTYTPLTALARLTVQTAASQSVHIHSVRARS